MKLGNFNKLATNYAKYRPSYNYLLINKIIKKFKNKTTVLDIGAGTGKLTQILKKTNYYKKIIAVEPSKQMINHGIKLLGKKKIIWKNIPAEKISFEKNSIDLICAASSFHWFIKKKNLDNFSKMLKKNSFFLIIYNSRKTKLSMDEITTN